VFNGDNAPDLSMDTTNDSNESLEQHPQRELEESSPSVDEDPSATLGASAQSRTSPISGRGSHDLVLGALSNADHSPRVKPWDNNNALGSSSRSSDDFELQDISTGDEMTDDEEIGLTAQDKRHRTRRRRKNTQLGQRVVGIDKASKQETIKADKNVLKALLINALLIASWYLFSLSISIVRFSRT
jgi:solute carrier family 35 protein C2